MRLLGVSVRRMVLMARRMYGTSVARETRNLDFAESGVFRLTKRRVG
jgi:hypothetical protein